MNIKKCFFALFFLLFSAGAFAATYQINVSGIPYGTGTANITVTGPEPGTQGLLTAISGNWAGQTITGFSSLFGADNKINAGGVTGYMTFGGLSFTTNGPASVNISSSGGNGPIAIFNSNSPSYAVQSITATVTVIATSSVPTLNEWAMLILVVAMVIGAVSMRRRSFGT